MKAIQLIIAMLLVWPGTSVLAQEQTVEGAQEFLTKVLPGSGYIPGSFLSIIDGWGRIDKALRLENRYVGKARITEVRRPGDCRTAILFDSSGLFIQSRSQRYDESRRATYWESWKNSPENLAAALSRENYRAGATAGAPTGFSWSDVLEVKVSSDETAVFIKHKGVEKSTWVEVGSKDMATRVAYAMEFLKSNCDKGAGTGF